MLSLDTMRQIRAAYDLPLADSKEMLKHFGNPTPDEIVEAALEGIKSANRNERVLMLRILKWLTGEQAIHGILAGLNDPVRRVRKVAIQSSEHFLQFPEVTERLKAIVTSEQEI